MIVVPTYNMLLCPDAALYLPLDMLRRSAGGSKGIALGDKLILIVAKENQSLADMTDESFYPLGVVGSVSELNHQGFAVVRTENRVNLEEVFVNPDHTVQLTISRRNEVEDLESAVEAEKLKNLLQEMRTFASGFNWAQAAEGFIDQIHTLGMAACAMSPWLTVGTVLIDNYIARKVSKRTVPIDKKGVIENRPH